SGGCSADLLVAHMVVWLSGALNALFVAGLLVVLPRAFDLGLKFGIPPPLEALLRLPVVTTALAVGVVLLAIPVWHSNACSKPGRLGYFFFAVVAVAFVPFLAYWNLLGIRW